MFSKYAESLQLTAFLFPSFCRSVQRIHLLHISMVFWTCNFLTLLGWSGRGRWSSSGRKWSGRPASSPRTSTICAWRRDMLSISWKHTWSSGKIKLCFFQLFATSPSTKLLGCCLDLQKITKRWEWLALRWELLRYLSVLCRRWIGNRGFEKKILKHLVLEVIGFLFEGWDH